MASGNFLKCHEVTAKWEGGWSDHPADPGGKTMYGITLAKYREHYPNATAKDLRNISKANALAIYQTDYWAKVNGERLAAGVDLATYDAAVNSGVSRGLKWLKASVGGPDEETVKKICRARLSFVQALSTWKTFGKGWARRIADIEAKGVAWALAAKSTAGVTKSTLERESKDAKKKSDTQSTIGGGAGGVGAPGLAVSPEAADQMAAWALGGCFAALIILAVFLVWRSHVNKQRAEAYAAEAMK